MAKLSPSLASRKARFKAALAFARKTAKDWAASQEVTEGHLHAVLNGRESKPLEAAIEHFITKHIPEEAA